MRSKTFRRGLRFGVAASLENLAAMRDLRIATVIDAGANVGQFSLLIRGLHPQVEIHAFEPFPAAVARFTRLFAGDAGVHLHPVALGEAETTAPLHISRRSDNSSLLPINRSQTVFAPGTEAIGTVTVPVRRLDAVLAETALPRPVLLKVDTQGGELALLTGAEGLFPIIDYIYVEVSFVEFYTGQPLADRILDYMQAHGYRIIGIGGVARNDRDQILQADLLFERLTR
ncbi:hypothetical protein VZ95_11955 [Elstera litoralis]|uniref:Methyltransferase FkbM domain-containing protein n=1 Tax=Elstera litoralis TaxID=552518 RepID=A0A0F3IRW7_9PROT|nr:hypothetical protein VZ95_11955 [Elstera litoralis]